MKGYKIKDGITKEELEKAGFLSVEDNGETYLFCFVQQDINNDLVKSLISIYENKEWQKKNYKGKTKQIVKETIGLKLDRKGKVIMNERFKSFVTMWRVQFSLSQRLIYLTSLDPYDRTAFCNYKTIEQYCAKLIDELKAKDFIEFVEENEIN